MNHIQAYLFSICQYQVAAKAKFVILRYIITSRAQFPATWMTNWHCFVQIIRRPAYCGTRMIYAHSPIRAGVVYSTWIDDLRAVLS
jgi:hypothetical protein